LIELVIVSGIRAVLLQQCGVEIEPFCVDGVNDFLELLVKEVLGKPSMSGHTVHPFALLLNHARLLKATTSCDIVDSNNRHVTRSPNSAGEAGYSVVVFDVAGILGGVFAGFVSDRVFRSRRAPIVVIMMLLLAAMTYGYSHLSHMGRVENLVGIAVMGFLLYGPDSVTAGVAAVDFGRQRAASLAAGFINGIGSIGGALSGVLARRLSQAYGWESVFGLFAPLCLIGALLMATLWNKTAESDPIQK